MEVVLAGLQPWSEPCVCANKTSVDLPSLRKTVLFLGIYPRNCAWVIGTNEGDGCSRSFQKPRSALSRKGFSASDSAAFVCFSLILT